LNDHAGQVCDHRKICEALFRGSDVAYPALKKRLPPLISHLRKKIERDPKHPEILLNKNRAGYVLRPDA
jgi:DNA-binding response OmpR family regulator